MPIVSEEALMITRVVVATFSSIWIPQKTDSVKPVLKASESILLKVFVRKIQQSHLHFAWSTARVRQDAKKQVDAAKTTREQITMLGADCVGYGPIQV